MKRILVSFLFFLHLISVAPTLAWALSSPLEEVINEFQATLQGTTKGYSSEVLFPAGRSRLLSCRTGFQNRHALLTGLNIRLNPNETLRDYTLHIGTPDFVTASTPVPLKGDTTGNSPWASNYTGDLVLPIVLSFSKTDQDIQLEARADLTVCSPKEGCRPLQTKNAITLLAKESRPTAWCGLLQSALQTVAQTKDMHSFSVQSAPLDKHSFRAHITLPYAIGQAIVQPQSFGTAEISEQRIVGKKLILTILSDKASLTHEKDIPFFIKTDKGSFAVSVPIPKETDKPLLPVPSPVPFFPAVLFGFILFFFSPLWSFWLSPPKTSVKKYRELLSRYQKATIAVFSAWIVFWVLGFFVPTLIRQPISPLIFSAALIYLMAHPVHSPYISLFFLVLLPKPLWDMFNDISVPNKIILSVYWMICLILPFWLSHKYASAVLKTFRRIRENQDPSYLIFIRLPYVILLFWIFVGFFGQQTGSHFESTENRLRSSPTLVQVTEPICLSCVIDNHITFKDSLIQRLIHTHRIQLKQLSGLSPEGKTLMKRHETTRLPLYVLIFPDGREFPVETPFNSTHLTKVINKLPQ